jgi:hypothetical protein
LIHHFLLARMKSENYKSLNWITKENLITVAIGAVCGFFVLYPISDFDIFWHLAAGKEIVKERHLLFSDPFSYTDTAQRWFDVHWLFQVITFLTENAGGLGLLLVFKATLFAVSISILFRSVPDKRSVLLISLPIVLIAYSFRYLVTMRPIIFTILFISLFFYLLERYLKHRRKRYLLFLIPVQIAWVNSQGLFLAGPFIFIAYLSGELLNNFLSARFPDQFGYKSNLNRTDLKIMTLFSPLLLLSMLVNPYYQDAVHFAFRLFRNITPLPENIYSSNVTENMSVFSMMDTDYAYYAYSLIGIIVLLSLSSAFSKRYLRFTFLFSSLMFLTLAYMAQRNLILFAIAFIPHFCWNMKHLSFSSPINKKILKTCISFLLCIFVLSSIISHLQFLRKNFYTIAPFSFPVNSTEYLKDSSVPGNMFNADRHGGYLIWKFYPEKKVFLDTRLTLRSREFFAEYLSILKHPEVFFPGLCKKYGITHVILPQCGTDLYFRLTKYLYDSPEWNLVSTDGSEALFIMDSLSKDHNIRLDDVYSVDSICQSLKERFIDKKHLADEAVFHLANMLVKTDNLLSAESILADDRSQECRLLYSRIKLLKGQKDSALTILNKIITEDPGNVQAQTLTASVYLSMNRPEQVKKAILSVLVRDPLKVFNMLRVISKE